MPIEKRVPPKNPKKDLVAKETAERAETKAKVKKCFSRLQTNSRP